MLTFSNLQNNLLVKQPCPVIWLCGLSGAGKTTLAKGLSKYFEEKKIAHFLLDGDELRKGINKNLGFTEDDRNENLRRAAEIAKLFQKSGVLPICSFISPTKASRSRIAEIIPENFLEVYVSCSLEACEKRDVKGFYKKARAGEIADFTGISAPFEAPEKSFLKIDTELYDYDTCLKQLIVAYQRLEFLNRT